MSGLCEVRKPQPKRKSRFESKQAALPIIIGNETGLHAIPGARPCYQGVFTGHSVLVSELEDATALFNMGCFGKPSTSKFCTPKPQIFRQRQYKLREVWGAGVTSSDTLISERQSESSVSDSEEDVPVLLTHKRVRTELNSPDADSAEHETRCWYEGGSKWGEDVPVYKKIPASKSSKKPRISAPDSDEDEILILSDSESNVSSEILLIEKENKNPNHGSSVDLEILEESSVKCGDVIDITSPVKETAVLAARISSDKCVNLSFTEVRCSEGESEGVRKTADVSEEIELSSGTKSSESGGKNESLGMDSEFKPKEVSNTGVSGEIELSSGTKSGESGEENEIMDKDSEFMSKETGISEEIDLSSGTKSGELGGENETMDKDSKEAAKTNLSEENVDVLSSFIESDNSGTEVKSYESAARELTSKLAPSTQVMDDVMSDSSEMDFHLHLSQSDDETSGAPETNPEPVTSASNKASNEVPEISMSGDRHIKLETDILSQNQPVVNNKSGEIESKTSSISETVMLAKNQVKKLTEIDSENNKPKTFIISEAALSVSKSPEIVPELKIKSEYIDPETEISSSKPTENSSKSETATVINPETCKLPETTADMTDKMSEIDQISETLTPDSEALPLHKTDKKSDENISIKTKNSECNSKLEETHDSRSHSNTQNIETDFKIKENQKSDKEIQKEKSDLETPNNNSGNQTSEATKDNCDVKIRAQSSESMEMNVSVENSVVDQKINSDCLEIVSSIKESVSKKSDLDDKMNSDCTAITSSIKNSVYDISTCEITEKLGENVNTEAKLGEKSGKGEENAPIISKNTNKLPKISENLDKTKEKLSESEEEKGPIVNEIAKNDLEISKKLDKNGDKQPEIIKSEEKTPQIIKIEEKEPKIIEETGKNAEKQAEIIQNYTKTHKISENEEEELKIIEKSDKSAEKDSKDGENDLDCVEIDTSASSVSDSCIKGKLLDELRMETGSGKHKVTETDLPDVYEDLDMDIDMPITESEDYEAPDLALYERECVVISDSECEGGDIESLLDKWNPQFKPSTWDECDRCLTLGLEETFFLCWALGCLDVTSPQCLLLQLLPPLHLDTSNSECSDVIMLDSEVTSRSSQGQEVISEELESGARWSQGQSSRSDEGQEVIAVEEESPPAKQAGSMLETSIDNKHKNPLESQQKNPSSPQPGPSGIQNLGKTGTGQKHEANDGVLLLPSVLWALSCRQPNFASRYVVYHHFRALGWVVTSGLKFGGDFLLYEEGPSYNHASYVVMVNRSNVPLTWHKVMTTNRIAEVTGKGVVMCDVSWPTQGETFESLSQVSLKVKVVCRPQLSRDVSVQLSSDQDTQLSD